MFYLILAILCTTGIAVFVRVGESKCSSNMGRFIFNYVVCVIAGACYTPQIRNMGQIFTTEGFPYTFLLGAITGILYMVCFILTQQTIRRNGVMLSSVFNKLGVIVPILFSLLFWGERPGILQVIGIILALAAIVVFHFDKNKVIAGQKGGIALLLLMTFVSGGSDSILNIYNKSGNPDLSDVYLLLIFVFALLGSIVVFVAGKEKLGIWDVIIGIAIGVPNYFASRLLMLSLKQIPAIVAYPVYSVSAIFLTCCAGIFLFKEKLTRQRAVGLVMVLAAVALLH